MQSYSQSTGSFVPIKTLAQWTVILLVSEAMADLAGIGVSALQLFLTSSNPGTAAAALIEGNTDVSQMPGGGVQLTAMLLDSAVSSFVLIVFIATVIVFLIWQHRAYNNLPALGVPRPEFSSGWVIGSWFVPFLNLVRPYQIVKYIWGKSDPDTLNTDGSYGAIGGDGFTLKIWWFFWLASNIVDNLSARLYWRAEKLSDYMLAEWTSIFGSLFGIIAAYLAITVVRNITARQEERYKRLLAASQQQFWSQQEAR